MDFSEDIKQEVKRIRQYTGIIGILVFILAMKTMINSIQSNMLYSGREL